MTALNSWLDSLISATAWEMTPPKAYGPFHLIFTFVGIALCILLAWRLKNVSEKTNRVILLACGLFLAVSEVYKQLFYYYYIGNNAYQWWIFPFQLCSVPMYLCLIAPFLKPGKAKNAMYNFMTTFNLLGGFMAFIEPSGIIHSYWTLTLHAFIWHMSLVFIGMYLIASHRSGTEMSDYKSAVKTFLVLCCIAFIINLSLRKVSDGTVNMFFIGPSVTSLAVFKQISEFTTWYIGTALYIPSVCLGAFIVFYPVHLYAKKRSCKQPQRI